MTSQFPFASRRAAPAAASSSAARSAAAFADFNSIFVRREKPPINQSTNQPDKPNKKRPDLNSTAARESLLKLLNPFQGYESSESEAEPASPPKPPVEPVIQPIDESIDEQDEYSSDDESVNANETYSPFAAVTPSRASTRGSPSTNQSIQSAALSPSSTRSRFSVASAYRHSTVISKELDFDDDEVHSGPEDEEESNNQSNNQQSIIPDSQISPARHATVTVQQTIKQSVISPIKHSNAQPQPSPVKQSISHVSPVKQSVTLSKLSPIKPSTLSPLKPALISPRSSIRPSSPASSPAKKSSKQNDQHDQDHDQPVNQSAVRRSRKSVRLSIPAHDTRPESQYEEDDMPADDYDDNQSYESNNQSPERPIEQVINEEVDDEYVERKMNDRYIEDQLEQVDQSMDDQSMDQQYNDDDDEHEAFQDDVPVDDGDDGDQSFNQSLDESIDQTMDETFHPSLDETFEESFDQSIAEEEEELSEEVEPSPAKPSKKSKSKASSQSRNKRRQTQGLLEEAHEVGVGLVDQDSLAMAFIKERPRRNRVAPLEFWRGEHMEYKRSNDDISKLLPVPVVVKRVKPTPVVKRSRARHTKVKREQTSSNEEDEQPKKRSRIIYKEDDDEEPEEVGIVELPDPKTPQRKIRKELGKPESTLPLDYLGAPSTPDEQERALKGVRAFDEEDFSSGFLVLPPLSRKQHERTTATESFYVASAEPHSLRVTVADDPFKLSQGGTFHVPAHTVYALENLSKDKPIKLFWHLIKGSTPSRNGGR